MVRFIWTAVKWGTFMVLLLSMMEALKWLLDLNHYIAGLLCLALLAVGYVAGMLDERKSRP